ncbi:hypothetical protein CC2G_003392 [Coprinopsis cinerea AmutBmut pab1-1]|nr:hypothetical protein CC2G_003392 [Coprinopsis cinerea AmutBmut pab1-1]
MPSADNENGKDKFKQHIKGLVKALKAKKQRKKVIPHEKILSLYMKKARWIKIGVHLFFEFHEPIYARLGLELTAAPQESQEISEESQPLENGVNSIDPAVVKRLQRAEKERKKQSEVACTEFLTMLPKFPKTLKAIHADDPDLLEFFLDEMRDQANSGRNDDSKSLKSDIIAYIPLDPNIDHVNPPIVKGSSKAMRGYNHDVTGGLLVPLELFDEWQKNPARFRNKFKEGKITITEEIWPRFCYPEGTKYDHSKSYPYRPFDRVPDRPDKNAKSSKAQLHKVDRVETQHIAYAATQCYLHLSSLSSWSELDNQFSLRLFYENIIAVLSLDIPWAKETLEWYQTQVPGLHKVKNGSRGNNRAIQQREIDPVALLLEQAQADEAEAHPPPPPTPPPPPASQQRVSEPPRQTNPPPTQSPRAATSPIPSREQPTPPAPSPRNDDQQKNDADLEESLFPRTKKRMQPVPTRTTTTY